MTKHFERPVGRFCKCTIAAKWKLYGFGEKAIKRAPIKWEKVFLIFVLSSAPYGKLHSSYSVVKILFDHPCTFKSRFGCDR